MKGEVFHTNGEKKEQHYNYQRKLTPEACEVF